MLDCTVRPSGSVSDIKLVKQGDELGLYSTYWWWSH